MTPLLNQRTSRIGIHYYPDTQHYTHYDLQHWLPRLSALGIEWLVLQSPQGIAIPEFFVSNLVQAGIKPIIKFNYKPDWVPEVNSLHLLLKAYADWGVTYINLFDQPNVRSSWPASAWAQQNLVERFLDVYLPNAEMAAQAGLTSIFPALEPGGDYWDTAFLRASLLAMQRRGYDALFEHTVLGAYGWLDQKPLNWGAGGPERWPGAVAYTTAEGQEDQRGLYVFDWYQAISRSAIRRALPVILMGAGPRLLASSASALRPVEAQRYSDEVLSIIRLLAAPMRENEPLELDGQKYDPIPQNVLACNFWLLTASPDSPFAQQGWFQSDGSTLPIVDMLTQHYSRNYVLPSAEHTPDSPSTPVEAPDTPTPCSEEENQHFPIAHYLLLPRQEWGVTEWHLDLARPYILKYHPTIGFSPAEAAHAAHVLVVGEEGAYPEEILNEVRRSGCYVERISGDGIFIASELASR